MWYDTNKLKDVNEIKIIITKRTRKGRNTMKKEIEALKRNEPMKVDSPNYYGFGYFKCPKCSDIVVEEYDNYCRECGQRLDWSDEQVKEETQ